MPNRELCEVLGEKYTTIHRLQLKGGASAADSGTGDVGADGTDEEGLYQAVNQVLPMALW